MRRIIREPLFHFALLGALIYAGYGLFGNDESTVVEKTLVVSAGEISWMTENWRQRWGRPPTEAERQGFIDAYVREGILYLEALDMGLDEDDVIFRRRLAQKLEFLTQDLASMIKPAEGELLAYFEEHKEEYREDDLITFAHLFFDPDKREETTLADAEETVASFDGKPPAELELSEYGDAFMLQSYYPEYTSLEVLKAFGSGFADSLFALSEGVWHAPVLSGYGTHAVYVKKKIAAPDPVFEALEPLVRQDWQDAKREEVNEQFYASLRDRYTVIIEDDLPEDEAIVEARNE